VWLPLVGLLAGILVGTFFGLSIPVVYARYAAVAILAALDSVLGAVRSDLEGRFDNRIFVSGFLVNAVVAALLTFLADRLGVELYIAAIVAFGVRIFNNIAIIRRLLVERLGRGRGDGERPHRSDHRRREHQGVHPRRRPRRRTERPGDRRRHRSLSGHQEGNDRRPR
jgi:small basic protein